MIGRLSRSLQDSPRPWSRWLSLFGFGLLLVAVATLLRTPEADGFEVSIYDVYPVSFWALLVAALFVGQLLILRDALVDTRATKNWQVGFLLCLLVGTILLFMPYIRGYPVYGRADLLTHLGYVREIQATGGDPFLNIYQNLHQLFLALSYATGVDPLYLVNAVAGIISLFSIVASYALLSAIFDRRRVLLTLPFVVVLVSGSAHLNPSPYAQSVLLLPFVLYLFVKAQETETFAFRAPLAITVVAIVLYHPLTAVFLLGVVSLYYGVISLSSRQQDWSLAAPVSRVTATSVLQFILVVFIAWYYNFAGIILRFETVVTTLLSPGEGEGELDRYGQTVAEYSPELVDLARVGFFRYGQRAILLAIGTAFVMYATWSYLRGRPPLSPYLSTFTHGFVLFSTIGVVFLVVGLVGGFGRPLVFAQYFAVFVAGSLLAVVYDRVDRQALVTASVSVLLVVLIVASMATLYHSPMGGDSNPQATQQDFAGAESYLENDLQQQLLLEHGTTLYRFEDAFAGTDSNTVQRVGTGLPPRLGYTEHQTLGENYGIDQVIVVTERGKAFYPAAYPGYEDAWRIHPTDFDRLATDPTVSHVYSNDEFDIYLVEAAAD